jgi:hypothetical protein
VSGGNYELHRYRHVDGSGGWVRSPAFAGVQVTVDGTGAPWIRTAAGLTFRVTLDANDVPIGVNSFNPPGGTALQIAAGGHGNLFLPPVVLTPNGHLHIWNFDNTESWYDAGATPVTFNVITGSIPYLWAVASDGRIWYQR